jgi:uncharacterized protein YdiU (UPF0061 family)
MSSSDASPIASPATSDPDRHSVRFGFENTYARLPERFYARLVPVPVATPRLIRLNVELARNLGLDMDALGRIDIYTFRRMVFAAEVEACRADMS